MAKGLRAKTAKRLRVARYAHWMEMKGNALLAEAAQRQSVPNGYDYLKHTCLPLNAFVHPNNPAAAFP